MTPNGTTTGQQERSGKKATVATVGVGAIITALYLWAAAFWAFPTALGAALATVALFFVGYMMGIPAYMLGARVLADKEITGNELRAALTWPFEVALVAFTGSKFRGSDGQRTIARQIQREDDNSSTVASGIGAYLIVGISVVLALGLVGTAISLMIEIIWTMALLTGFAYVGGMLFYFWFFGTWKNPSGKTLLGLSVYPMSLFRTVAATRS